MIVMLRFVIGIKRVQSAANARSELLKEQVNKDGDECLVPARERERTNPRYKPTRFGTQPVVACGGFERLCLARP